MTNPYLGYLTGSPRQSLEALVAVPDKERFELRSEVDLARLLAVEAVQLYNVAAYAHHEAHGQDADATATMVQAMGLVRSSLLTVASVVESAAKIEQARAGTLTEDEVASIFSGLQTELEVILLDHPEVNERMQGTLARLKPAAGPVDARAVAQEVVELVGLMDGTVPQTDNNQDGTDGMV